MVAVAKTVSKRCRQVIESSGQVMGVATPGMAEKLTRCPVWTKIAAKSMVAACEAVNCLVR
jgi:hypothetical protein